MAAFKLVAPFKPRGDQPQAIEKLTEGIKKGYRFQTLLGVTGCGKTFTMANVVARVNRPTLVIAPNKTLAAQLCAEFRRFFPENAVEYFVSYYDYYQPEAYVPHLDLYIEKDASINEEIDKLRHRATSALLTRRDVLIVASVSCIYNLGSPEDYSSKVVFLKIGESYEIEEIMKKLISVKYERTRGELERGKFRLRGDVLEIIPRYEETALRMEFFGDELEKIVEVEPLTGEVFRELSQVAIYPATHFVTIEDKLTLALTSIEKELKLRLGELRAQEKLLEAQRLETRTRYDLEMLRELGYCAGIENYSRHFSGKAPGEPPDTLIDYFSPDFLVFLDESHLTIPQLQGMYEGDHSRKVNLVEHGFRLPSALDNRPLTFEEFLSKAGQMIFVSATPAEFELRNSQQVVEVIVRPTGLVDPEVVIKPAKNQVDNLLGEIKREVGKGNRVLVTTLTKKTAEDLNDFLVEKGIRARYLHSEIDTLERVAILSDLRRGKFDVLVGINLLREGLDLPEVSLVAILDADKEGFLRSERSLIQTMGRAARNVSGKIILYADEITNSIRKAVEETNRRRKIQLDYNRKHGIKPETIRKAITDIIEEAMVGEASESYGKTREAGWQGLPLEEQMRLVETLEEQMIEAANELNFELAAELRDKIRKIGQSIGIIAEFKESLRAPRKRKFRRLA